MKVIMALVLSGLLLQQSALAARYDDDDDDDEPTRAKVMQPAQPQTPVGGYFFASIWRAARASTRR